MATQNCPRCSNRKLWSLATGYSQCAACRYRFKPGSTWWQSSRLSGQTKARLLEYFCLGVPAYRLRFHVKVDQKAVQRFNRLCRSCIYQHLLAQTESLDGQLELDETTFGGLRAGPRGWGAEGKTFVFGIYKRNVHVRTYPVSTRRRAELLDIVDANTTIGSLYTTDEYRAYASLRLRGTHVTVAKEKGIPKGRTQINGIEGFWSYAKHWLYTYRQFRKDVFPLFLKEVEWRFNNRHENHIPILSKLMKTTTPDPRLLQV